jgi:hypothetical protein
VSRSNSVGAYAAKKATFATPVVVTVAWKSVVEGFALGKVSV